MLLVIAAAVAEPVPFAAAVPCKATVALDGAV